MAVVALALDTPVKSVIGSTVTMQQAYDCHFCFEGAATTFSAPISSNLITEATKLSRLLSNVRQWPS